MTSGSGGAAGNAARFPAPTSGERGEKRERIDGEDGGKEGDRVRTCVKQYGEYMVASRGGKWSRGE